MVFNARKLCCAPVVLALVFSMSSAICVSAQNGFAAIAGSFHPTTDTDTGAFTSAQMSVDVVLAPQNAPEISALLADLYNTNGNNYQHWLAKGDFYSRFAPSSSQTVAVTAYFRASGLTVAPTLSPFLLRVSGPSSLIASTFRTALHTYRNRHGVTYFSNASQVQLPQSLVPAVLGVVGLSNTVRLHSLAVLPGRQKGSGTPSCETPYVTAAQLFNLVNNGVGFPYGYGGGPGCTGLTPSQDNAIYGAPDLGLKGQGAGVNLAVFELSAYQHSDIAAWTGYFYGGGYKAPLVDITVDGGPLNPACPTNDQCPAAYNGYAGDIEVDADIEMQLSLSPAAEHILVYNAPNDYTGQTELDEYSRIAGDDTADVISSSWGLCENDAGAGYAQAENLIFEQMALQGQSMFGAAGDTGAFDCIRSDGTTIVNVDDPSSQPWVTSVGGTSLESFNPKTNPDPNYPTGVETVWNVDDLCNASASEGGQPGFFWCAATGAGAGGNSQYWARPTYQNGPGITNRYTAYGNGTTNCVLARHGQPCREVPDISANADPYTGYAEYCTGSDATPNSQCTFSASSTPVGWFQIGGTSLSSPLWSAIIADHDSYWRGRIGNVNPLLYFLYNADPQGFFNDITGIHQTTNNNGLFPTTPGYDMSTGIGTPKMKAIITLSPQR